MLTRPGDDRDGFQMFQVYRQPLPNASINLEEIPDGEAAGGGTFRGAFTGGNDKGGHSIVRKPKWLAPLINSVPSPPSEELLPCEQQGALQSPLLQPAGQ